MSAMRTAGKLLVVDDSKSNIDVLFNLLGQSCEMIFATRGEQALELARKELPDLVLLDVLLPDLDGFEVCKTLKAEPETTPIPIIFLSAKSDVKDMVQGYELGAVDYVSKPFNQAELRAKVETQLALKRTQEELKGAQQRELDLFRRLQLAFEPAAADEPESDNTMGANRILIVDDSITNIRTLAEILRSDYELLFATDGNQAIAMAIAEEPDLIILDIVMPEMDGYAVCRTLKGLPDTQEIPIIFVSALDEAEDEARGLELGAIDYITKPYQAPIIRARVRNHLELVRYRELLKSLTVTDSLTRIPNRRHFDKVLHREWTRAVRERQPLSLLLLDIDHFKHYNDHYGHLEGDGCLREVAQALAQCTHRETDLIARYGGEEFAAVLPNTDSEGAAQFSEQMLRIVRQMRIEHVRNQPLGIVTVSVGAVTCLPTSTIPLLDVLVRADECLYKAKKQGRNQVVAEAFPGTD